MRGSGSAARLFPMKTPDAARPRSLPAGPAAAGVAAALALACALAGAAERTTPPPRIPPETGARVIVSLKPEAALLRRQALSAATARSSVAQAAQARADALAARAGVALTAGRMLGARAQVVQAAGIDSATLAARLAAHPDVEYAVPDRRRRITTPPNDPLFAHGPASGLGPAVGQWYVRQPDATLRSAINAQGAWDVVTGNPSIVVAVLDTGVLANHVDLAGRVLPGYDMIEDVATANDGNGRDSDASDPGDWITPAEDAHGVFQGCGASDSSWHGTQVSGIIGAAANDGVGMAGVASGVRILPVRVLGKCGGYDSDIVAGIYWAAGVDQPGLAGSKTRARVLNLSLGSEGACSQAYRDAIATLAADPYRAILVTAAGNSTGHAVGTPANCPGVVAVTGLRHAGSKVGFSDIGPEVTIAAPGGNCVNITDGSACLYPILTTSNSGLTRPNAGGSIWTDSYNNISVGTSFSAPMVAGTVALMLSARPELTPLQVIATLQATARPFPTSGADNGPDDPTPVPMCRAPDGTDQLQCYCSAGLCGAGMIDAAAAALSVVQGVPLSESAGQLLDFGEQAYAVYFPGHPATQEAAPFRYRHYLGSGAYLGVVVNSDSDYVLGGVYVMGGPFGSVPRFVGRVTDFITPRASAQAAPASR